MLPGMRTLLRRRTAGEENDPFWDLHRPLPEKTVFPAAWPGAKESAPDEPMCLSGRQKKCDILEMWKVQVNRQNNVINLYYNI